MTTPKPYERRAYYYETDKMGIVHHSNYIRWFEEARLDYMKQAGLLYTDMEADGILMPVVSVSCRYRTPVLFDEKVFVKVSFDLFNGVRAGYSYEIVKASDGSTAVTGKSEHCFIDEKTRKPLNLKKRYREFYDKGVSLLEGVNAERK